MNGTTPISTIVTQFENLAYRKAMALEKAFLPVSRKTTVLCIDVTHDVFKVARLTFPLSLDRLKKVRVLIGNRFPWEKHNFAAHFPLSANDSYHGVTNKHHDLVSMSLCGPIIDRTYHAFWAKHQFPKNLKREMETESSANVTMDNDSTLWAMGALEILKLEGVCPDFPILSVTLGKKVRVALIESPNQIKSIEIATMNPLYTKLSTCLNVSGYATPLALLEEEHIIALSYGKQHLASKMVDYKDQYNKHVEAFIEDACNEIEKRLALATPISTILVGGEYSSFVKQPESRNLESVGRQKYVLSPQKLAESGLSSDLVPMLGIMRNCLGNPIMTSTYPSVEQMMVGLKRDSLVDLFNHQVMLRQYFDVRGRLALTRLVPSDARSPVIVLQQIAQEAIPIAIFKQEERSVFTERRLRVLKKIQTKGVKGLPSLIKNTNDSYLTTLGKSTFSCIKYHEPDHDQETLREQFPYDHLLAFSSAFLQKAKDIPRSRILLKSRLNDFLDRYRYFDDPLLKEWNSAIFSTEMWTKIHGFAEYFMSTDFQNIYRQQPVQIIHGEIKRSNLLFVNGEPIFYDLPDMRTDVRLLDFVSFMDWGYFPDTDFGRWNSLDSLETYFGDLPHLERVHFHRFWLFNKVEKLSRTLQGLSEALSADELYRVCELHEELLTALRDLDSRNLY